MSSPALVHHRTPDSPRWCDHCEAWGDHHRHEPELRCGPWDDQGGGVLVCRKCGAIDAPEGDGPFGF